MILCFQKCFLHPENDAGCLESCLLLIETVGLSSSVLSMPVVPKVVSCDPPPGENWVMLFKGQREGKGCSAIPRSYCCLGQRG